MTPSQQFSCEVDVVKKLEVKFWFNLIRQGKGSNVPLEFDAQVEANVWCTDGEIISKRMSRSVAYLRARKARPILFWEKDHCIDSLMHRQASLNVYQTFNSKPAQAACKKLNDRIAILIAPTQRVWIQSHNLAAELMKSAHEYLVAYGVMMS